MTEPATTDDVPLQTFKKNGTTGAIQFRFGKYYVLIYCNRVTDKKQVARYVADYGIERPAADHEIKALGFRITVNDEEAKLYRYSKKPITEGRDQWAFSIRRNSIQPTVVYGVSLQVFEADPVNRIDFNTQSGIDAALACYRASVEKAEFALRQELLRIANISSKEYREPTKHIEPSYNPNVTSNKSERVVKSDPRAHITYTKGKPKLVVFKRNP